MIKLKIASNGHLMLAGANRFMLASTDSVGSLATTMTLIDYQSTYGSGQYGNAPDPQPVVQRKAGTLFGDVPVLFTFTGNAPSNPQARVVQGSTVIKDWTTLTSISVVSTTAIGTITDVPQGCDYTIQVRDGGQPANTNTTSNGSQLWGVGIVVLYMGQSNMKGTIYAGSYAWNVPGTQSNEIDWWSGGNVKGTVFGNCGWIGPLGRYGYGTDGADTASGGIYQFLRMVSNALKITHGKNIPVAMVPWAFNATGIENYIPGTGGLWNSIFQRSGTNPDAGDIGFSSPKNFLVGDFEGMMWHQGEANQGDSSDTYKDKLVQLFTGMCNYVAQFGRTPDKLFFGPAVLGNYGTDGASNIESIRIAASKFEALAVASGWRKARIGWSCIDCARNPGDSLHFGDNFNDTPATNTKNGSASRSMRRSIQTVLFNLGAASFSGRGPSINPTVQRNGQTATLSVVHEGGTALRLALPGSPIKGFYANTAPDFTGTDIAITAALANSNTQIAVTFPNGTAFPVYLKYMGGRINSTAVDAEGFTASCNPNITNPVYDNVVYPTGATGSDTEPNGLPLLPTFVPLLVN